jgi:hypothetical protein
MINTYAELYTFALAAFRHSLRIGQIARDEHHKNGRVSGCCCEDCIPICARRYTQTDRERDNECDSKRQACAWMGDEVQDDDRNDEQECRYCNTQACHYPRKPAVLEMSELVPLMRRQALRESISKSKNGERYRFLDTSVGNGQWLRKSLDIRSVSAGGFTATRSDPTLNMSLSRPSSFDNGFAAREEPCNHSRSAARTLELGDSSIAMSRWSISASSSHRLVLEKHLPITTGRILTNSTSSASRPKIH